ncbi:MAG: TIGR00730 family Rossman fold protein [Acidobacteria bacterium]|nr:TIGR00730 family Rossman fold protein [Acidobacteriota bacterium]
MRIKRICVFCGSSRGTREIYLEQAQTLGRTMAGYGMGLVYGGGGIGLMGEVARAVIEAKGEVIGVIPYALATKERALEPTFETQVELRIVRTMHERKAMMASLADAFIALPGGLGTFDELFEVLTWAQLGIHQKPIGILNLEGYFDPLLAMIDRAIEEGFVRPRYRQLIVVSSDIADLLVRLFNYQPLEGIVKWVDLSET